MKNLLTAFLLLLAIYSSGQNFFWSHNKKSIECNCPSVGDYCGGGIVVYIFKSGDHRYVNGECHGIIASINDIVISGTQTFQWYNGSYTTTGATSYLVGYGYENTNAIVSAYGSGSYAAKICYDLVLNGYDDWVLPSSAELLRAWFSGGSTLGASYWSSTEVNANSAIYQTPPYNSANTGSKSGQLNIKAVRYF